MSCQTNLNRLPLKKATGVAEIFFVTFNNCLTLHLIKMLILHCFVLHIYIHSYAMNKIKEGILQEILYADDLVFIAETMAGL